MSKILIIAEHLDGKLNASTAKCVSAAQALAPDSIDVAVLAADPAAIAAETARISGVTRVLAVANAANAHPVAQVLAPQIAQLAAGYTHVFGPSTTFGKDLIPASPLLGPRRIVLMAVSSSHVSRPSTPAMPRQPSRPAWASVFATCSPRVAGSRQAATPPRNHKSTHRCQRTPSSPATRQERPSRPAEPSRSSRRPRVGSAENSRSLTSQTISGRVGASRARSTRLRPTTAVGQTGKSSPRAVLGRLPFRCDPHLP